MQRRRFLQACGALGASGLAAGRALAAQPLAARPAFTRDPFALGVASGYPTPDGVVLWTRLATDPLAPGGGLDPVGVVVRWEIARDEAMRNIVARGTATADPEWAHAVHVEARGLAPDRWFWYRFTAGDARSPVGRTRTAPAAGAAVARLRFVFASCQHYETGYYGAWRHAAADAPDLVAFLGDYIYEGGGARNPVRVHGADEPYTLEAYRVRYARYRSDADLQAAHAACPWIVTWDDHEVDNDYADAQPEDDMPPAQFLLRRAAAYRAYYEHMPLPASMRPDGPRMRIHTALDWGTLARFHVLDDRQYRDVQACPRNGRAGGANTVDVSACAQLFDAQRSLLGHAQERWLEGSLASSRTTWNVLAQQTPLAQFDQKPGPGRNAWTDGWDGYPAARRRLLDYLGQARIANPFAIGGDVHVFTASDLKPDFDDPTSGVVASEVACTSISSRSWSQERIEPFMADNPHIKLIDARRRGYARAEMTRRGLVVDLRGMQDVTSLDSGCDTTASFVVAAGRAGIERD
jgi:alkaline phosphatase D